MSIKEQMLAADKVLSQIGEWYYVHDVAVLGGAPRDWYMGNACRDIDIYITGSISNSQIIGQLSGFADSVQHLGGVDESVENTEYKYNPHIKCVFGFSAFGQAFNLIHVQQPSTLNDIIESFSFDICKATYSTSNGVVVTAAYEKALKNKELKVTSELYCNGGKYCEKMRERFPDWEFSFSDELNDHG